MSAYEEFLIKIKAVESLGGFDNLEGKVRKAQTDMKAMENTTNAASKKMKTDLEQVNNTRFDSLNNKFKSTISSMTSTAASGAKAIKSELTSMVDGVDGAITSVAAGMGVMELFDKAMDKALTKTQLRNAKPQDYQKIMDQYQQFTVKSSASDDDISKMLRYTYAGDPNLTYQAINAVDAASYSADKLQRQEGIRGWGTYLSGGWSAASGMMKDEPLTADQKQKLMAANTYEERIAAMKEIAAQKGSVDKFGNSLSTTVDGPLGKYNTALAAQDAIVRGATASFETLMTWIAPVIAAFMALDPSVQSTIGTVLTAGIVVTAAAAGLGILVRVLNPVGSAASGLIGKLKDSLSGSKDIKDKISGLKDSLDGKKLTSTVTIKATSVYVNGKTTGTPSPTPTSTGNGKNTPVPAAVPWWQPVAGLAATSLANLGVGSATGIIKDNLIKYLPFGIGQSSSAAITQTQTSQFATNPFGIGSISGEGVGRTIWNMLAGGQDFGTASGNTVQTMYNQSQIPTTQGWQFPTKEDLLNAAKEKILGSLGLPGNLSWDNVKEVIKLSILGTLGLPGSLTWDQVKATIKTKILNSLGLPGNLSWDQVKAVVKQKILGTLGLPGNISLDMIKGWIMNAIGWGGAGGDSGADTGYGQGAYYEPVTSSSSSKTTHKTTIHAPITIQSISNREEGDRAIKAITNHLNQFNNANGN